MVIDKSTELLKKSLLGVYHFSKEPLKIIKEGKQPDGLRSFFEGFITEIRFDPHREKTYLLICAPNEDSDQLALPRECADWSESSLGAHGRRHISWYCGSATDAQPQQSSTEKKKKKKKKTYLVHCLPFENLVKGTQKYLPVIHTIELQ